MALFRGKDKNPFDELISFCQSNRIDSKQEVRLRGIIDRIHEFKSKLHQPTVMSEVCDNCRDVQGMYLGMTCPKCNRPFRCVKQTDL